MYPECPKCAAKGILFTWWDYDDIQYCYSCQESFSEEHDEKERLRFNTHKE